MLSRGLGKGNLVMSATLFAAMLQLDSVARWYVLVRYTLRQP